MNLGLELNLSLNSVLTPSTPTSISTFNDFDEISTNVWYSLHPNASRISTLSFGSGVSQITDVSGKGKNGTQSIGASQVGYSTTELNGFPCLSSIGDKSLELNVPYESGSVILFAAYSPENSYLFITNPESSFIHAGIGFNYSYDVDFNYTEYYGIFIDYNENFHINISINPANSVNIGIVRLTDTSISVAANNNVFMSDTTPEVYSDIKNIFLYQYTKLGEFLIISAADATEANVSRAINILKSRWGAL